MSPAMIPVAAYGVIILWRLWLVPKRWSLPLMRGPGWFFNTEVGPEFYPGEGRGLLRRYRATVLAPFAIELPLATATIVSRHYGLLIGLILVGSVLSGIVQIVVPKRLDRLVRASHAGGAPPAVSRLAISLEHRTLASYSRPAVELAIAAVTVIGFAVCTVQAMEWHSFRAAFLAPLIALYAQLGLLLVKDTVMRLRMKVPLDDAESYARWREGVTWHWSATCDWIRVLVTCVLLSTSVVAPLYNRWGVRGRWVAMSPLIALLFAYLFHSGRQITRMTGAAREMRPVDFSKLVARRGDERRFALGGLLYYDPENPLFAVRAPQATRSTSPTAASGPSRVMRPGSRPSQSSRPEFHNKEMR